MTPSVLRILVTGANGKLGRFLQAVWPDTLGGLAHPLWQMRQSGGGTGAVTWDIATQPYGGPDLSGGVVVHLAGGRADLAGNTALTLKVCHLAAESSVRHVFIASSSAVYAPDGALDLTEDTPCAPQTAYGQAKLDMELAITGWAANRSLGVTFLRIGNVLGADSLIGGMAPGHAVTLTPVPGRAGGPLRSYIGPRSFADVLGQLCLQALQGHDLPRLLNIGTAPAADMADLLQAAGADWHFGPATASVVPRFVLAVDRMLALVDLPETAARPDFMVAEWRGLVAVQP